MMSVFSLLNKKKKNFIFFLFFFLEINENLSKIKNMHEASQKFENSLNHCNSWLDRMEKDLSPVKYKFEPLELIMAEKNVEQIMVII